MALSELAYIEKIVLLVFTFIIIAIITSLISNFIQKILKSKLSNHYSKLIANIVQYSLVLFLVYYINAIYFKFDLGVFATSLGLVSVAIAYSSQQIIQNFISGLIISFGGLIELDNWVEINPPSVIGKVKDINLMRVTLRDVTGKIHLIPNSLLMTTRVVNYSKSGFVEVQVPLIITSNRDYESVKRIILDILEKNKMILPNVSKTERVKIFKIFELKHMKDINPQKDLTRFNPMIMLSDLQIDKVTINIHFWISEIYKKDEIISEVLASIKEKISKDKIDK